MAHDLITKSRLYRDQSASEVSKTKTTAINQLWQKRLHLLNRSLFAGGSNSMSRMESSMNKNSEQVFTQKCANVPCGMVLDNQGQHDSRFFGGFFPPPLPGRVSRSGVPRGSESGRFLEDRAVRRKRAVE